MNISEVNNTHNEHRVQNAKDIEKPANPYQNTSIFFAKLDTMHEDNAKQSTIDKGETGVAAKFNSIKDMIRNAMSGVGELAQKQLNDFLVGVNASEGTLTSDINYDTSSQVNADNADAKGYKNIQDANKLLADTQTEIGRAERADLIQGADKDGPQNETDKTDKINVNIA